MNEDKIESDTSFANRIDLINAQLSQITEIQGLNKLGDIPDTVEAHTNALEKLKFELNDKFNEVKTDLKMNSREIENTCKKRFQE